MIEAPSATALNALRRETERTGAFLAGLSEADWDRPTRCPPLTVLQLTAHAMRGGIRIGEMLDGGPVEGESEKDGATYFAYDPVEAGAAIVRRAVEASASLDPANAAEAWTGSWAAALDRAEHELETDDRVYRSVFGLMRLSEYLRTRIVEVTIHAMDMRDAFGLPPDPSPEGLRATCDVLRQILGADTVRLGIDELHLALAGTGRAALTDADRAALGPLADLFPLLA